MNDVNTIDNQPKVGDELKNSKINILLWILVAILLTGGIIANHLWAEVAWSLRLSGWIILAALAALVAFKTTQGKAFWQFALAARVELRKVIWPTRDETVHTTMIIAALVVVMALFMWGLDTLLMWLIGFLTV